MSKEGPKKDVDLTPIDEDGQNHKYRRINELRRDGYYEERFADHDAVHMREFEQMKAELNFYEGRYEVISVQGLHIIFLEPELADLLEVRTRVTRARVERMIQASANDNGLIKDPEA